MTKLLSNQEIWKLISPHVSFGSDFHNSLDDCYQWIVPWLEKKWIAKQESWDIIMNLGGCTTVTIINNKTRKNYEAHSTSPSLAFISAFSQIMESK